MHSAKDVFRKGLMGILNCTPDSFYDGCPSTEEEHIKRALQMESMGAEWIDIGGESTRPKAEPVSLDQELQRVIPVVQQLRKKSSVKISIDTSKSEVARQAMAAGAQMVNDVSGLSADPKMADIVARSGCQVVIMHSRGNPQTMDEQCQYTDLIQDVLKELDLRVQKALKEGVKSEKIWIDPGFGFAKSEEQNWELLRHLGEFKKLGYPLLVGLSRKRFLGGATPNERLVQTLAANFWALQNGADVLRVHDVGEHREMMRVMVKVSERLHHE